MGNATSIVRYFHVKSEVLCRGSSDKQYFLAQLCCNIIIYLLFQCFLLLFNQQFDVLVCFALAYSYWICVTRVTAVLEWPHPTRVKGCGNLNQYSKGYDHHVWTSRLYCCTQSHSIYQVSQYLYYKLCKCYK